MDFTDKSNHNVLYNFGLLSTVTNSSTITNGSNVTNTSSSLSVTSSIISSNSSSSADPYSLSFLTENQKHYSQLLDDLSIIDNMCDTFGLDTESSVYGNYQDMNPIDFV